jgi:hypothetical protein
VQQVAPDVHSFYRLFEVPGLGHCHGGNGGQPTHVFEALVAWVEDGIAPDVIPIDVPQLGQNQRRILCPYPQKVRLRRGDGNGSSTIESYCL